MFNSLIPIDDVNFFFKEKYYDLESNKIECIIRVSSKIVDIMYINVDDPTIFNEMTIFDVIYFFVKLLSIRIDLYSLFYKPSNYGHFTFDDSGSLDATFYNKMVIAYCYYDIVSKKYVIPLDNVFNKKYLFKYFNNDDFIIFDNVKTISCYNNTNKNSNVFFVFLRIYCKHLNKIHCLIKYKIHL